MSRSPLSICFIIIIKIIIQTSLLLYCSVSFGRRNLRFRLWWVFGVRLVELADFLGLLR